MTPKRSIFEEVGETRQQAAATGGIDRARRGSRRAVRIWLIVLFVMVAGMILVGGLTRLTDSGLSITEWAPLRGAIPPLSDADWQAEFERYKAIPEFQVQNSWMALEDFQRIYWWEWGHRQLGRAVGLVWALGFAGLALAGKVPVGWSGRLWLIGILGGIQGAVGWWMVSSGLEGSMLDVASYRLATHLGLAFVILGFIAWYIMLLGREERDLMQARRIRERRLFGMATGWLHLTFVQILLGALVAGIDAGTGFTDWPLMAGQVFPPDAFSITPVWRNFLENPGLVQFMHRIVAYLLLIYGIVVMLRGRRSAHATTRGAFTLAFALLCLQALLGIAVLHAMAEWHVAILHLFTAILLWVAILRARFLADHPVAGSVRDR